MARARASGQHLLAVVALVGLWLPSLVSAATLVVDAAVPQAPATYRNLTAAVAAASNGDTVLVRPGVYTGTANSGVPFTDAKSLTIQGDGGWGDIVIDCGGANRALSYTGDDTSRVGAWHTVGCLWRLPAPGCCCAPSRVVVDHRALSLVLTSGLPVHHAHPHFRRELAAEPDDPQLCCAERRRHLRRRAECQRVGRVHSGRVRHWHPVRDRRPGRRHLCAKHELDLSQCAAAAREARVRRRVCGYAACPARECVCSCIRGVGARARSSATVAWCRHQY